MVFSPPIRDLREIILRSESFEGFRDRKILITGASGFVGTWLLSTLMEADSLFSLNTEIYCVTRDMTKFSHLKGKDNVKIFASDIRISFPSDLPDMDFIFHAATPSSPETGGQDATLVYESALLGTQNVIDFASKFRKAANFIHTSSGAVEKSYVGKGASEVQLAYKEAKAKAEEFVIKATGKGQINGANPRLYAFAGPGISTTGHFVAGQFMNAARQQKQILIKGNPNTKRSFMYPSDLVIWLIEIVKSPTTELLRVGSTEEVTIASLANHISNLYGGVEIVNKFTDDSPLDFYVPNTVATRERYNLQNQIKFDEIFVRWKDFLHEL